MKLTIFRLGILFIFTLCVEAKACPFTIVNDGPTPIIVTDPYGQTAVYIKKGQSRVIDPTIHSLWKYVYNEKLDFYIPLDDNTFYKKYRLSEAYCVSTADNELLFGDLGALLKKPTDRLSVTSYEKPKLNGHDHSH